MNAELTSPAWVDLSPGTQVYLVGGAVRDALLGRPVRERDWVVVGGTAKQMRALGYLQVGKDFPVFLHPQTREEYALARLERKTAPGYHGFEVETGPEVTLEQDLTRRDLTINAMAQDERGQIIDPCGGLGDLRQRRLRHISPAFAEDPLRVLRVARFAARYAPYGFTVARETHQLMCDMVETGEIDHLVPERVWTEVHKALGEDHPAVFFSVLRGCGALARLLPELDALFGVPQPPRYHPEIDTGVHTLLVLEAAARLSPEPAVRFAALLHDLGKGDTAPAHWPSHHGHEPRGVPKVEALCQRLRAPNPFRDLARLTAAEHGLAHSAQELRPKTLLAMLERLDALRRPERFEQFLLACEADARGRIGFAEAPWPSGIYLRAALERVRDVAVRPLLEAGLVGAEIQQALAAQRIENLITFRREQGLNDATEPMPTATETQRTFTHSSIGQGTVTER